MKSLPFVVTIIVGLVCLPLTVPAWDGFDASTTGLVEIIPGNLPSRGDTVDVRSYDDDTTQTYLVENVTQNARTVEVVVRSTNGGARMLVMEGH
ncbi:MAG: DUF5334 domain-containing protein [Desulfovibrio sp.]|nr:DUF5334 domain-containing protein [Desulfovibrio sp.]